MLLRLRNVMFAVIMIMGMAASNVLASEKPVNFVYNGQYSNSKLHLQEDSNITYIPLRTTFEMMGYRIVWDNITREITLVSPRKKDIYRYLLTKDVLVKSDGEAINMNCKIINGSTYLNVNALHNFGIGYAIEKMKDGNTYFYITLPEDTKLFSGEVKYGMKDYQDKNNELVLAERYDYAVDAEQGLLQYRKQEEEIIVDILNKDIRKNITNIHVDKNRIVQNIRSEWIPGFIMTIGRSSIEENNLGPTKDVSDVASSSSSFWGEILIKRSFDETTEYTIDSKLAKVTDGIFRSEKAYMLSSDAIELNERDKWAISENGRQIFIVKDQVITVDAYGEIKEIKRETDIKPLCTYYDNVNKELVVLYSSFKADKVDMYLSRSSDNGSFGIRPGYIDSFISNYYGNPSAKVLFTYNKKLYGIFNNGVSQYIFRFDKETNSMVFECLPDWLEEGYIAQGHDGIYYVWSGGEKVFYCKLNI